MNGFFNPENRFWAFAGKIVDVLLLSVLWLLFSVPLVTAGAATTALYYFTLHQVEDTEGGILRSFVSAFCSCFVKATVLWIGEVLVAALLLFNVYYCLTADAAYLRLLLPVFGAIVLVVLLTQFYLFPLIALFRFSIKKTVTHAFVMAMGNLFVSLLLLAIWGAFAFFGLSYLALAPFLFGLAVFLSSYPICYVLRRYMPPGDTP